MRWANGLGGIPHVMREEASLEVAWRETISEGN